MKIDYDQSIDALNLRLRDGKIMESDEISEGIIFDYDKDGKVIPIEILDASEKIDNPLNVNYEITKKEIIKN